MAWGDARVRQLSDSHQTVFKRLSGSGEDIMTSKQEVVIQGGCVTSKRGHHKLSYYEQNSSKYNFGQIIFIAIYGDPILKWHDLVLSMFLIFG